MTNFDIGPFRRYQPVIPELNENSSQEEIDAAKKLTKLMLETNIFYAAESEKIWYKKDWYLFKDSVENDFTFAVFYDENKIIRQLTSSFLGLYPHNYSVATIEESLPGYGFYGNAIYSDHKMIIRDIPHDLNIRLGELQRIDFLRGAFQFKESWESSQKALQNVSTSAAAIAKEKVDRVDRYIQDLLNMNIERFPNVIWPEPPDYSMP